MTLNAAKLLSLFLVGLSSFLVISSHSDPTTSLMYNRYASYYDGLYYKKDYAQEVSFLNDVFAPCSVSKVLDVGCGTGSHMALLEQAGYECSGIDINQEMLDIARTKVSGSLLCGDIRRESVLIEVDAAVCMFAVFNHFLTDDEVVAALENIRTSLKPGGLLVLDLYNPQSSGEKVTHHGDVTRIMTWELDPASSLCHSTVEFVHDTKEQNHTSSSLPLKIYSMQELEELLFKAGYKNVCFYDNYTLEVGTSFSKNLLVVAHAE